MHARIAVTGTFDEAVATSCTPGGEATFMQAKSASLCGADVAASRLRLCVGGGWRWVSSNCMRDSL
jgi:hypothetical protein